MELVMLILTQSPWSPNDLKTLRELTSSAKSEGVCQSDITDPDILFLLPHSPMINNQAVNEKKVFDSIKKLAMEIKIYIAECNCEKRPPPPKKRMVTTTQKEKRTASQVERKENFVIMVVHGSAIFQYIGIGIGFGVDTATVSA